MISWETFLHHVEKSQGRDLTVCKTCRSNATHLCGGCYTHAYCGSAACQDAHWFEGGHQFECISGKDDSKRQRDPSEEEEEPEGQSAQKRAEPDFTLLPPERREQGLENMVTDVWSVIVPWLSGRDLKSLYATSRALNVKLRKALFERVMVNVDVLPKAPPEFRQRVQNLLIPNNQSFETYLDIYPNEASRSHLRQITFGFSFDERLNVGVLPQGLTHLTLKGQFNRPLDVNALPGSLTHLVFGYQFNQPLLVGELPQGLTHLMFGARFNQQLENGMLPESLTHLAFGFYFDQPLARGVLPQGLTHLRFGWRFSQPWAVIELPKGLTHLTFRGDYVRPLVPGVLPQTIKVLDVSDVEDGDLQQNFIAEARRANPRVEIIE